LLSNIKADKRSVYLTEESRDVIYKKLQKSNMETILSVSDYVHYAVTAS
jgi:hypothetical protein